MWEETEMTDQIKRLEDAIERAVIELSNYRTHKVYSQVGSEEEWWEEEIEMMEALLPAAQQHLTTLKKQAEEIAE
jgi:hypothetical protein